MKDTKTRRHKRSQIRRKTVLTVMSILLVFGAGFWYFNSLFNQMDRVNLDERDLGIDDQIQENPNLKNKNIVNIALFGIDTQEDKYSSARSDSIMIATLDLENEKMKITSLMRDSYVHIPGRGFDKLGHAYAYGGPAMAVKTINTNYDMNITDYVTVNFFAMEKIVDSVGGIELNVSNEEARIISGINSGGKYKLNGSQVLAYTRIRSVGTDFARTERQRIVMQNLMQKVLGDTSIPRIMALADNLLPHIQTSLSRGEILTLLSKLISSNISDLVDTRVPIDGHGKDIYINNRYYLLPVTLEDNVRYLHSFIYENDSYKPSQRLLDINYEMPN